MGMRPRNSETPPNRHIVKSFAVSVSDAMTATFLSSLQSSHSKCLRAALASTVRLKDRKRTGMGRATLLVHAVVLTFAE